jgi:hypothetical protein
VLLGCLPVASRVRRRKGMTVRAQEPEVLGSVVPVPAVDMVNFERDRFALPGRPVTTYALIRHPDVRKCSTQEARSFTALTGEAEHKYLARRLPVIRCCWPCRRAKGEMGGIQAERLDALAEVRLSCSVDNAEFSGHLVVRRAPCNDRLKDLAGVFHKVRLVYGTDILAPVAERKCSGP